MLCFINMEIITVFFHAANAINMQLMSNGHGKSQRQKSDGE